MQEKAPFLRAQLSELAVAIRDTEVLRRFRQQPGCAVATAVQCEKADALVLGEFLARRREGESYAAIALDLNRRGLRGRNGARWYASSVRTVLQRLERIENGQ